MREVLQVISRSRSDEQPVFDAILKSSSELCSCPLALLLLCNPGKTHFEVAAHSEGAKSLAEFVRATPFPIDPANSKSARSMIEGRAIQSEDSADDEIYRSEQPHRVYGVDQEGIRTALHFPLMDGDNGIGVIILFRKEVRPFTEGQIALVEAFAAQAVIAIENVRQFRELATRFEREEATREILEVISQSRDNEQPVFDAILRHAQRLCGAPFGNLSMVTPDGTQLEMMADGAEIIEPFRKGWRWPMDSRLMVTRCIREMAALSVDDILEDPLTAEGDADRDTVIETGLRSGITVPLVSGGRGIGCMALFRMEVRPFEPDEIAMVETFAEQAVIAIENVRQFRELQTRLEREAATREILQVISQSNDDEQPVFEAILESACRLCDAPLAYLTVTTEDRCHVVCPARRGAFEKFGETLDNLRVSLADSKLALARAIEKCRVFREDDISEHELYKDGDPDRVSMVENEGARSLLVVPLINKGTGVGSITLYRRKIDPFQDDDVALVESFAAQAVIAIENVRQFRELQARLEREAATREILQVIGRSPDDEQPVFQAIHENASRLCDAPFSGLFMLDAAGDHIELVSHLGVSAHYMETSQRKWPLSDVSAVTRSVVKSDVVHIHNLAEMEAYKQGHEPTVKAVEEEGTRTFLAVPLMKGVTAVGSIGIYRREIRPFSPDQIELLKTFAAQAVIAIDNVRQFRELHARLEREAATREILQVISRSRADEKPVFDAILENASRLCSAPLAFLSMTDEDREIVTVPAHRGARTSFADILDDFEEPLEGSPLVATIPIREGQVILSDDLSTDTKYTTNSPRRQQLTEVEGARSLLAVPLLSDGQSIGAIVLYRREVAPFSEDDVVLVQSFAAQAVIAVENVKQFRALEEKTEEVQALNEGLEARVEEQVDEIERMGRLKRFLSPQVADAVVSSGSDKLLSSHRALIATLFCDMRGFTAFCETAEPEETIEVLQTYHEEMGKLMSAHGAGVDHRMGDGIMVIFNDPLPCEDPAGDALKLGLAMRDRMAELGTKWRRLGFKLGFGVGISLGYATVGMVGSEGRYEYTANGTAVNLAARLCDKARDGEILLSPRAYNAVEDYVEAESSGEFDLKGIKAPVEVFRVTGLKA